MPLPWKKVTRLSQFVTDLHPSKRGGSLVVETGFPTSLIDLFVKNRERMKKPSLAKKKKNKSKKKDTGEVADPKILSPATPPTPAPATLMSLMYPDKFWGPAVYRIENRLSPNCTDGGDRAVDAGGLVDSDAVKKNVAAEKANSGGIFMAILKTFIVVVLALGTKKLAVGITASAFVLLFIEYVGYRMLCCFEPCWKSLENLKVLIQWCSSFNLRDQSRPDCNATIDEIEIEIVEEHNTVLVVQDEEIQSPEVEFHEETNTKKKKKRVMEEDEVGEIAEQKNLHSRSSKLRAKMLKKFVPIKFRGSKKGKKSKAERETGSSNNEQEEEEDHEYKSSQPPLLKKAQVVVVEEEEEEEEKKKINGGIHRSKEEEGSMAKICNIVCKKMGRREKKRKTIIVFVLIVAGLVGGRSLGIVLTFTLLVCLTVSWISRERNKRA